ncbi:hypothetical protein BATDEDRAFT_87034 [Batrachochytrium dendrobatidis JAM81]|uniref:HORMA domain-containing protein n=2 Tax=Batrachochytrium dendrobatidis TaxID=109871 RepID=F4NY50_BATDJ|nr:uncharacterized protein BATDEDRAFT_87034 [Batrachochytrium dendrobatidis JAM81]EGF82262.1 hypothetical protein BATDEDRAFT_87034 [Batrachochytrium dendrobatidis JAM81]OAJ40711.1 hypothetical protein BDEG_24416 [Batrachochytrium dendrobatidis JEL423]|eukprot:XP_006677685.1 hypothetical protein BATDEDRAFT_87034 [Batrachochytrium dendrobatidis JAM81]
MLASAHSSGLDTAMSCVKEETRGFIKLAGTVTTVLEFFQFAINNILYQRGLYPPESFTTVKKYNLHLLIATDNAIKAYLDQIMHQLQCWISAKTISKLVMVISTKSTGEILERWQFDVNLHQHCISNQKPVSETTLTTEKQTNAEIAAIMRQITASVSFLPILDDPCTFNILVYTDKNALVPPTWVDSDPKLISHNAEQVKLRSFSTAMHKIDGLVAYKLTE